MRRSDHLVDTDGLSQEERAELSLRVLRALQVTVTRFETDVPWVGHEQWSDSVRAAADRLVVSSGKTVDRESYQATGMLERADEEVWTAFCAFAGHAHDASAWSPSRAKPVAHFSDAGHVVVVRVDEVELRTLELAVHPARTLPSAKARPWWSRRRT